MSRVQNKREVTTLGSERRLKVARKAMPLVSQSLLALDLREVATSLQKAVGQIVEAHTMNDVESFIEALRLVQSAQVVVDGIAAQIAAHAKAGGQ